MGDMICIFEANSHIEAELVRAELQGFGVQSYLISDDAGGVLPQFTFTNGTKVMILKEDKDKALEILKETI